MTRESETHPDADQDLIREFLKSRSEVAFLGLYDRHTDRMHRFAARLAGGPGRETDDLVQEAWLRALGGLARFRGDSSLSTWLCGIVFNRWREVRNRESQDRCFQLIEGLKPPEVVHPVARQPGLQDALSKLPDGYREVLLLHDALGYTHEEIARHFGIVEGTSKSQLHRARRALREALEGKGVASDGG